MKSRFICFLTLSLVAFAAWELQAQTRGSELRIIQAERQPGADMGAKIAAADAALGEAPGEIQVGQSGAISTPVKLSANHILRCATPQVVLTMATDKASIRQLDHTQIHDCEFGSSQNAAPAGGGG